MWLFLRKKKNRWKQRKKGNKLINVQWNHNNLLNIIFLGADPKLSIACFKLLAEEIGFSRRYVIDCCIFITSILLILLFFPFVGQRVHSFVFVKTFKPESVTYFIFSKIFGENSICVLNLTNFKMIIFFLSKPSHLIFFCQTFTTNILFLYKAPEDRTTNQCTQSTHPHSVRISKETFLLGFFSINCPNVEWIPERMLPWWLLIFNLFQSRVNQYLSQISS